MLLAHFHSSFGRFPLRIRLVAAAIVVFAR
jgi:hypothetical protein